MRDLLRMAAFVAAATLAGSPFSQAAVADQEFTLAIKDHRFNPTELIVPAGQKIRLIVENQDPTPEEFESYTLNREKVVAGGGRIVLYVGPLKPGRYEFFGEFNQATARGWLVAR